MGEVVDKEKLEEELKNTRKAFVEYVMNDAAEHCRELSEKEAEEYIDDLVKEVGQTR